MRRISDTSTLNDRESYIPLLNDLRQAGLIKDYELREENSPPPAPRINFQAKPLGGTHSTT